MQIVVDVRIPPALKPEALARAPHLLDEELRKTLAGDVALIEAAVSERAPVDRGTLRAGTQTSLTGTDVNLTGRVWNPSLYGPAVDAGGRPHWAPVAPIQAWARRVIGGPNANKVARAVWASIAKAGTKAKPFWGVAWKATQATVEARHVAMLSRMMRRLVGES